MNSSRGVSGRKVILAIGVVLVVIAIVIADRLVYFRQLTWSGSTIKGIGAVYFGCEKMIELEQPSTGDWLVRHCDSKWTEDHLHHARAVTVFPGGCLDKSVVAWGPELHYWAETWMPFSPVPGRFVLFEDKARKFVSTSEFSRFECP